MTAVRPDVRRRSDVRVSAPAYHGGVLRPADRPRWRRPTARRLIVDQRWVLFDVALALGLLIATLEQRGERGVDGWWLVLAAPLLIGMMIRRRWPLLAFAVVGVGATVRHLDPAVELDLIDLAVPLALYTLATGVRSRRTTAIAFGSALIVITLLSLFQVIFVANVDGTSADNDTATDTSSFKEFGKLPEGCDCGSERDRPRQARCHGRATADLW